MLASEYIVYNGILPVGISLFMISLIATNSVFHRILSTPVLQQLGKSSYAFYLLHIGLFPKALQLAGVAHRGLLFVLCLLLAQLVYATIEKPLQQRLRAS